MAELATAAAPDRRRGLAFAAAGVALFAPGALFVRLAGEVSGAEAACLRLAVAALCMAALARATGAPLTPPRRDAPLLLLCSLVTAAHFCTFVSSLGRTSIAHAVALCYTAPLFAALLARLALGERLRPGQGAGMALVLVAVSVLAFDQPSGAASLAGDALALASGATLGAYHALGRGMRERLPLFTYALWVYLGAALWLLPLAWPFPSAYPARAVAGILCQGLLATAGGHTLVNAALRRVEAATVSLVTTQEVTGGILLGILVLDEWPSTAAAAALLPLLMGLALVLGARDRPATS